VNHLALGQVLERLEVRNFEGAHRLDGHGQALIGAAGSIRLPEFLARGPQDAEHLGPIESLTLTVITEAHMVISSL
jgi:hypothetical protein